jgi:hypothetical protein
MAISARLKVLMAVAAAVVAYIFYTGGDEAGHGGAPTGERAQQAAPRPTSAAAERAATGRNVSSAGSAESARLYAQLAHRVSDGPSAGALFKATSWFTPPPPPPPAPAVVAAPPPPPSAPPLPFTVMGSYAHPGELATYFLTRGDRVFDVRVGDTIDNTYSVDGDSEGQLQLTYKPLNIRQTLSIGGS